MSRLLSFILHKKGGSPEPQNPYIAATYIESTGTQYIDTGIVPDDTFVIEAQFQQTTKYGSYPKLFGSEIAHNNQSLKVDIGSSGSNTYFITYFLDKEYNVQGTTYNTPHIFKFEKGAITYDGVEQTFTEARTLNSDKNIYLFSANRNGTAIEFGALQMFYCKIWKNGELVRDYVPKFRLSDYKFGLYDNVTNTFFENKGTGNFNGAF